MSRRHFLSIRAKIALTCGIPLAVSLATSFYWSGRSAEKDLRLARAKEARVQATAIALAIGISLEIGDVEELEAAVGSVRNDPDLAFLVVRDADGTVLAQYPDDAVQRSEQKSDVILPISVPIVFREEQGQLFLGTSIARLEAKLNQDRTILLLVGAATLVLGLATAMFFATRISRPIRDLQQAARRVANEDFDTAVSIRSSDEVGELAGDFAKMTAQLRTHLANRMRINAELTAARDEADAATKAKSQFLATVSHEIRTPMNGVIGMTGLLLDTPLDTEQREYAETVRSSAEALLTVINDVLDFSKIEAGKLSIECHPFDLQIAASEVVDLLAPKAAEKGIEMAFRYAPDMPRRVVGDAGRLRQILMNLVGNAIKFTEKGQVTIAIASSESTPTTTTIRCSVRDSGIGLTREQTARLFQRFTQADGSTTRRFGGTGLGLAICRQLVELMGGEIGVTSELGQGATFWFALTLELDRSSPEPAAPNLDQLRGARALVVDDNEVNQIILEEQLRHAGMEVVLAGSGHQALEVLRTETGGRRFDVIFVDYHMPGMDGEAFGYAMQGDPAIDKAPLVLLSSSGQAGDARRFAAAGYSGYLIKPVRPTMLLEATAVVLGRGRAVPTAASLVTRHSVAEEHAARSRSPKGPADQGASADQPPRAPATGRALLVEDNTVNQRIGSRLLEKLGWRVDVAANGREGLEMWETLPYSLVFMDCQMPEMDGYQATQEIRRREATTGGHTPIIAMTANAMQGDRERCLDAGMDDYLTKPIRPDELAGMITKWGAPEGAWPADGRDAPIGDRGARRQGVPDTQSGC